MSGGPLRALNHVSVTVADLDRSLAFYRDLLELPLLGRGETDSPQLAQIVGLGPVRLRWAELAFGGERFLELFEYVEPRGEPLRQRTCDAGCVHFALAVADLDALHERLVAAGVERRSPPVTLQQGAWRGARALYLRDPDGATVELIEFAPGSPEAEAAEASGRAAAPRA